MVTNIYLHWTGYRTAKDFGSNTNIHDSIIFSKMPGFHAQYFDKGYHFYDFLGNLPKFMELYQKEIDQCKADFEDRVISKTNKAYEMYANDLLYVNHELEVYLHGCDLQSNGKDPQVSYGW